MTDRQDYIFPISGKEKKPYAGTHGLLDAKPEKYWNFNSYGVAINCGMSQLVVIDIDSFEGHGVDGFKSWEEFLEKNPRVNVNTRVVKTPTNGLHLYYTYNGDDIGSGKWLPGIEIKARGGYIAIPPTPKYEVVNDVDPVPLPAAIIGAVRRSGRFFDVRVEVGPESAKWAAKWLKKLPQEYREDYELWYKVGMSLQDLGDTGLKMWEEWSKKSEKNKPSDCLIKWKTFKRQYGISLGSLCYWASQTIDEQVLASLQADYHFTDLGNSERLLDRYGDVLRYCNLWKKWLVWDTTRWRIDETKQINEFAKKTIRSIFNNLGDLDEKQRAFKYGFAMKSESAMRQKNMIELATSSLPIRPDDLDTNTFLLNVKNATIGLKNGVKEHKKEDWITKIADVEYDPNAECPRWLTFLNEIFDNNQELIDFIQKSIGYSLTGDTREQCIFILHGSGANGKSTFLSTITALLGDYAQQTPMRTLMVGKYDGVPNDVARMKGARFAVAMEGEAGKQLAESKIKQMTGGDRITARFMRAEFFEFVPQFKIWLGTNHKPKILGQDLAIWRRIRLIPFTVTIPEEKQDKLLDKKLREELPGILNWALAGCRKWLAEGLTPPRIVRDATESYKSEMDILGQFIEECCNLGAREKALSSGLYEAYKEWCGKCGFISENHTTFGIMLRQKGYEKKRKTAGNCYIGLALTKAFFD